ncbi:hypothetical protein TanjilG_19988 [Lupinus angustifolius]|uniref:Uncharacterized protein n=1 Tax=Lupinus angustifolius TaxID=3871 RepID=A0A4P1RC75_LUPAN|nr:PREDICTED: kunitz-type trypsin inhibitor-like 1 protein [Lupinus angustifolius]OIW07887.1 hypothetical protein TanjilG_19988 [Lupinus angustifolius]
MNSISLITISFFFFFFAFSAKFQLALTSVTISAENVVDRKGKPLVSGGEYHVLPALSSYGGGGLIFRKTGNTTCSTSVLQENLEGSLGQLLRFQIKAGSIYTGSIVDIEFVEKPDCIKSSKWRVVNEKVNKTAAFVGVGNAEDYPGNNKNGKFKIEKLNTNYKFMFCDPGEFDCTDIGKYNDVKIVDAQPLKLFQSKPLEVTFLKPESV